MNNYANTIKSIDTSVYEIPTERPESDGTLAWNKTTLVIVEIEAGGKKGLGYTYSHGAIAQIIRDPLESVILNQSAMDTAALYQAMKRSVRNLGYSGLCAMAISAIDTALWDLKARILELPLVILLGHVRDSIPIYGSGGFTSYTPTELVQQLGQWVLQGIPRVKMKVGRHPDDDLARVALVRKELGYDFDLFVDANGGYTRKQALQLGQQFHDHQVVWFEEPIPYRDREGLRLIRDVAPPGMDIAAGEYGWTIDDFRELLESGAVDVLQADATRCGGPSGFMEVGALCNALRMPLSSHCAPALHSSLCAATEAVIHLEYFHDHVRIENRLFDGTPSPIHGSLRPDTSRPGLGLELRRADAERYRISIP